jgi:hypothetical protein
VSGLERDHVDDQVGAVRDGEGTFLVAVEGDELPLRGIRVLVPPGGGDGPAVIRQRTRDGRADVAGAAEDECAA